MARHVKKNVKSKYVSILYIIGILAIIVYFRNEIKNLFINTNLLGGNKEITTIPVIYNTNTFSKINTILDKFN